MSHHTKDKGDQGVGFVIADLMSRGYKVALPICEHLPFDLIAIGPSGSLSRVSVKFRTSVNRCIQFKLQSSWADKHGTHVRKHDRKSYDALAIYCPDTHHVYYLNLKDVKGCTVYLRLDKPLSDFKLP
jgi:hypothetical protein